MSAAADSDRLPRGVYEATYLLDGEVVLMAIDSGGNRVAELKVSAFDGYALTRVALEGALERHEPTWTRPALELVR